jgi:hypothetical protein
MALSQDLMDALAGHLILPILCEFEKETGQAILATLVVAVEGEVATREVHSRGAAIPGESKGEVRVRLKEGFAPGTYSFAAESIFDGVARDTGFSGFALRGKLKFENQQPTIKITARTHRYNVWDWGDEFQL